MDGTSGAYNQGKFYLDSNESSSSSEDSFDEVNLTRSSDGNAAVLAENSDRRSHARLPAPGSTIYGPNVTSRGKTPATASAHAGGDGASKPGPHQSRLPALVQQPLFQLSTEQRRTHMQAINSLTQAAESGNLEQLEKAIGSGIDVDAVDIDGMTALHHAAMKGHLTAIALLIRHGAHIDALTPLGQTALVLAASRGHGAAVEYLIYLQCSGKHLNGNRDGLDRTAVPAPSTKKQMNQSANSITLDTFKQMAKEARENGEPHNVDALVEAVKQDNLPGAARLIAALAATNTSGGPIQANAQIEETDDRGKSLLAIACSNRQTSMAMLLIGAGASPDRADNSGYTPLMHAVKEKQAVLVAALLKAGARWDATARYGDSALTLAIDHGDPAVLNALVDGKADIWNATVWNVPLIIYAASSGKRGIVEELLRVGADMPDLCGSRALARCARAGETKAMKTLLEADADPNHKAADGHTAFTLAAANGKDSALTALLKKHTSDEWKQTLQAQSDNQGRTALMLATLNNKVNTVEYLLKNQADAHRRDFAGRTAMLWAASHADARMMRALLEHGATHLCADDRGDTIFIVAAEHDNMAVIDLISQPLYKNSHFTVNTPNKDGDTALIKAARRGHLDMVKLLLNKGANLLHTNKAGRTAIHEAVASGHAEVAAALQRAVDLLPPVYPFADGLLRLLENVPLISGALPERVPVRASEIDANGNSLMLLAAAHGQDGFLDELLKGHAIAEGDREQAWENARNSDNDSYPLAARSQLAVLSGRPSIDIEEKNLEGMTALCLATREGHYGAVKLLIENGAKVEGALVTYTPNCKEFITPLWLASRLRPCAPASASPGRKEPLSHAPELLVHLLLASGARDDIDRPSWQGQTPLIAAAGAGQAAVVRLLIKNGAKVDRTDSQSLTPMMHAAWHGHNDVVEILLNHGAAPNVRKDELSPLILAAEGGHDSIIRLLAKRGARIDHADFSGTTALIGAAKRGKVSTARLLIELGANLDLTDANGKSALYHASKANHAEIAALLAKGPPAPRDF